MRIEEFFKRVPVLETKMSVRNIHLDPDDSVLFTQTSYFRIIKYRLKLYDNYITYFTTDYHLDELSDEIVELYDDLIEYFKSIDYPHKLVLNLIFLERDKSIVGTFISSINEVFSFRFSLNSGNPELIILTAYYTTEQMQLILEDFIEDYEDYIVIPKDKGVLMKAVEVAPTGEIQPNIRLNIPFQQAKTTNKQDRIDYTYL